MQDFPFTNISDSVFFHAERRPDSIALVCGTQRLSYAGLADEVARATGYLAARGLGPGEHVGLSLPNSIERVILGLAIMRLGAVSVELPPGMPEAVLAERVRRFDLAATFVWENGPASPARIADRIGAGWRMALRDYVPAAQAVLDPDALRIIVLSSGSTGEPKGAIVTHRQRILRAQLYLSRIGDAWTRDRPLLLLAPAATSLVSQFLTTQLLLGGPSVLLPPFQQAQEMARAMAGWHGAICPMPPGLIRPLLLLTTPGSPLFPELILVSSGQPMAAADKLRILLQVAPNFHEVYGAAGCGMIAHAGPAQLAADSGSVGHPVSGAGIAVQVVGPDGGVLPPGAAGRLRLRGPMTALGYFNPEDNQSAEHYDAGWYYPGEVATLSLHGNLVLHGRAQEAMQLQDAVVYPAEIEDALIGYPQIAEAAVVAGAGETGIAAFVVPRPDFRQADFLAYCAAALPPNRRPRTIIQLATLPRTGNGKLDRLALQRHADQPGLPA